MHYTELFRNLRKAKGVSLAKLSKRSRRHRNTVINVESGRPVKFKTIAELMMKMGYEADSIQMRTMALLWLEAVSGISFSRPKTVTGARKAVFKLRAPAREAAWRLQETVDRAGLNAEEIDLLVFAAQSPPVLSILESVRTHTLDFALRKDDPHLRAAEEP